MTGRLFSGRERTAAVLLDRVGVHATLRKPDGTATENKYGKVSDSDINFVDDGQITAHRLYPNDDSRQRESSVEGGAVDLSTPRIAVQNGTGLQEEWRVAFPDGEVYRLIEKIPRKTHEEWRAELVQ